MKPHLTIKFFGIIFASWVKFLALPDQIFVLIAFMDFVFHFIFYGGIKCLCKKKEKRMRKRFLKSRRKKPETL